MTVEQALEHPWIAEEDESPILQKDLQQRLSDMVFLRLANFSTTKLQYEILLVFVKQILSENDLNENLAAFQEIDADHSGTITPAECMEKMKSVNRNGHKISEKEVQEFIDKVDINSTGEINYSQFLCATLTRDHFTEINIKSLFDFLDNYDHKYLTKESLLLTFKRNAREIELEQVESMMEELGINADAQIDLEQFRSLIVPNYKK